MHPEVKALIEHYHLRPLPVEGTLFVSTYRSPQEYENGKPVGTAMIGMYCDEPRSVSLFHKLKYDEVWHFYGGDPLRLVLLYPDGSSKDVIMGSDPFKGCFAQFVIPAGVWQAGHILEGGTREALLQMYPDRVDDINRLSVSGETSMPEGFAS